MIQKMSKEDQIPVENLLKEVFSTSFPQENPFFQVLVYKDQEQICGFLCYDKMYEQLEIEYLYVDPAYRRKKIASQLLEFMIQEASNDGVTSMSLEVNEHNQIAQKLYSKYGFKKGAIRKKYYGSEDGILMIRK